MNPNEWHKATAALANEAVFRISEEDLLKPRGKEGVRKIAKHISEIGF